VVSCAITAPVVMTAHSAIVQRNFMQILLGVESEPRSGSAKQRDSIPAGGLNHH
jgi:hypothetical protein